MSNSKVRKQLEAKTKKYSEYTKKIESLLLNYQMCKRIKDPKQFENGLAKVISDYLASQGIKDTSVNVKFIENW